MNVARFFETLQQELEVCVREQCSQTLCTLGSVTVSALADPSDAHALEVVYAVRCVDDCPLLKADNLEKDIEAAAIERTIEHEGLEQEIDGFSSI